MTPKLKQKLRISSPGCHLNSIWQPLGRHLGSSWHSWSPRWPSWQPSCRQKCRNKAPTWAKTGQVRANIVQNCLQETPKTIQTSNSESRMPFWFIFAASWAPSWLILAFFIALMTILAATLLPIMSQHSSNMSQDRPSSKWPPRDPQDLPRSLQTSILHQIVTNTLTLFDRRRIILKEISKYPN